MKRMGQLENGCAIHRQSDGYAIHRQSERDMCCKYRFETMLGIQWPASGELKSADLEEYIESLGVRNYFSVAHQNGPAEQSINSSTLQNRTQVVESGFMGGFWYRHSAQCPLSTDPRSAVTLHVHPRPRPIPCEGLGRRERPGG